ncbi:MAG: hypothetical protein LBN25_05235 [Christensenellaceae bacterium]|jgi:hypothetical protein|nr:hypothetical protein [Christensenellaceae bacterium]
MAKKKAGGYFGEPWILTLILAIIPFTSWVLAIVYRLMHGKILSGILAIPFGFIFWILDLVGVILHKKPSYILI